MLIRISESYQFTWAGCGHILTSRSYYLNDIWLCIIWDPPGCAMSYTHVIMNNEWAVRHYHLSLPIQDVSLQDLLLCLLAWSLLAILWLFAEFIVSSYQSYDIYVPASLSHHLESPAFCLSKLLLPMRLRWVYRMQRWKWRSVWCCMQYHCWGCWPAAGPVLSAFDLSVCDLVWHNW